MANLTAVKPNSNSVTKYANQALAEYVLNKDTKDIIADALGQNRVQQFVSSMLVVANDTKLKDVEPVSLFNCCVKSASYNLPIDTNLGYAYPVPYKNKNGVKIAQFQMGVKGIYELAIRTGQYARLNVKEVKEGEYKGLDFFGEPIISWLPNHDSIKTIVGYMGAYELTSGLRKLTYWSNEELENHARKYSKAHINAIKTGSTADDLWTNDFDAMAKKTVLKDLLKYAPKSIELSNALQFDQAVIERDNGIETASYIDNSVIYDIDEQPIQQTAEFIDVEPETEPTSQNKQEHIFITYGEYKDNQSKYELIKYHSNTKQAEVVLK